MPFDLAELNQATTAQRNAAESTASLVRLVAGPGSGKSQTIEQLIARHLREGTSPESLAVLSFTKAAVRDLSTRINRYCEANRIEGCDRVRISTLHSLALGLLKQAGRLTLYPENPRVLGDWELGSIFDPEFRHETSRSAARAREIRVYFEALWSTSVQDAPTYFPPISPISSSEMSEFESFYRPTTQTYACVLPGEIVKMCVDASNAGIVEPRDMLNIEYLIVDEYQDLNPIDITFIDTLIRSGITTFIAGDDDQSIYMFRHASPRGIQTLHERFQRVDSHSLGHCFRCANSILEAALTLISAYPSPQRIPKSHISMFESSTPQVPGVIHRWRFSRHTAEARAASDTCRSLINAGLQPRDILILLPAVDERIQLWPVLRQQLEQAEVPFSSPRETGFPTSKEGLVVKFLLRIIRGRKRDGSPSDVLAHRALFGLLRKVGVSRCVQLKEFVRNTPNSTYLDIFHDEALNPNLPSSLRAPVARLRAVVDRLRTWEATDPIVNLENDIGILIDDILQTDSKSSWDTFAATLPHEMTLQDLLTYFDSPEVARIQQISEAQDPPDTVAGDETHAEPELVRVMTMHGAKGLNAEVVIIMGLEEGILPRLRARANTSLLEEAARLLYVSMTRARAALIMSWAQSRMERGRPSPTIASRFCLNTNGPFVSRTQGLDQQETTAVLDCIRAMADARA